MSDGSALIPRFAEQVLAENPTHRSFVSSSLAAMSDDSKNELLSYVGHCNDRGLSLDYLAKCYNTIAVDTQVEQIYFKRHRKYRNSSFKDVADSDYFDIDYMKRYMYGLALTYFLWPNHVAMQKFFVKTFPRGQVGKYLEIGPGHGYYLRQAAALGNFSRMVGVDISPASVELSKDIMRYYDIKPSAEIEIKEADFLQFSDDGEEFSCIVMGEVLEHVEKPGLFLRKIGNLSKENTRIYVTTCLNAPAIDHIFLFSNLAEIDELAADSGLIVTDRFAAPYAGKSVAQCEAERLPVNVAYVMRKQ